MWQSCDEAFEFYIRKIKGTAIKYIAPFYDSLKSLDTTDSGFIRKLKFLKQAFYNTDKFILSPYLKPCDNDNLVNMFVHYRNIFDVYVVDITNLEDLNKTVVLLYELNKIKNLPVWVRFKFESGDFIVNKKFINLLHDAFSIENEVHLFFVGTDSNPKTGLIDENGNAKEDLLKALLDFSYERFII